MRLSKSFKGWSDQHVKFILYQARAELSLIITLSMPSCALTVNHGGRHCRAVVNHVSIHRTAVIRERPVSSASTGCALS